MTTTPPPPSEEQEDESPYHPDAPTISGDELTLNGR